MMRRILGLLVTLARFELLNREVGVLLAALWIPGACPWMPHGNASMTARYSSACGAVCHWPSSPIPWTVPQRTSKRSGKSTLQTWPSSGESTDVLAGRDCMNRHEA
jgi:hypothetical protein